MANRARSTRSIVGLYGTNKFIFIIKCSTLCAALHLRRDGEEARRSIGGGSARRHHGTTKEEGRGERGKAGEAQRSARPLYTKCGVSHVRQPNNGSSSPTTIDATKHFIRYETDNRDNTGTHRGAHRLGTRQPITGAWTKGRTDEEWIMGGDDQR